MQANSAPRFQLRFLRFRQAAGLVAILVFMTFGTALAFDLWRMIPVNDMPLAVGMFSAFVLPAVILFPLPWVLAYIGLGISRRLIGARPFQSMSPLLAALLIAGVFYIYGVIGICGWGLYESRYFPSPAPYPGATAEKIWTDRGGGRYTVTFKYSVSTSLDEVQRYYENEMGRFCAEGWKFAETRYYGPDYIKRRTASCEIPRPFIPDAQSFEVFLLANSDTQTDVLYFETISNVF
jgi:hypothetical protein